MKTKNYLSLFFSFIPLSLFTMVLLSHCKQAQEQQSGPVSVPRDTSITPKNAYSNLFLDSVQVSAFLENENDILKSQVLDFYSIRNYEFAWFNDEGLTLQAEGFWNQHDNYLNQTADSSIFDRQLHETMDTLLYADSSFIRDRTTLVLTELSLTRHFFEYAQAAFGVRAEPGELQWHIPKRRLNIAAMLDSLLSSRSKVWQPLDVRFHELQDAVFKYRDIEKAGGWPILNVTGKRWKKGNSSEFVKRMKHRLSIERYYSRADTSGVFTDSLEAVVKKVQGLYGLKQTGIIDDHLLSALNVPVGERIKQMMVNLERMKWMPKRPDNFIFINIPEYRFRLIEDGRVALTMDIVVGKAANRTVIFSDELKYIVFSPYWNIPRSIVRNEILPAMKRNPNYLGRNNMEITGYSADLPVVRQKPGRSNALGRVKFLFPNSYNIYFHDTPAKSLFSREKRAFSHGCIRLEQPVALAQYLLKGDSLWSDTKIKQAMSRKTEQWVTLKKTWPVYITYFTSWVDREGMVHFLEDIYRHDHRLMQRLFE